MTIAEQVIAQAQFMAPELIDDNSPLLSTVCQATVSSLAARLRDNLEPEDCLADFVTAAGMYALAAMADIGDFSGMEQLTAGDLTVRRGDHTPSQYLRNQADLLMAPYLKSGFSFLGV